MKQAILCRTYTLALATALTMGIAVTGCVEKDLYDPNYGKQELPVPESLPDFSNWSAINLSVDYEMPGCKTLIEIYTEYPYETAEDGRVIKTSKLPQFAAYTDDDSRFNGKLELPAGTKSVYLCASAMALPGCLKVEVKDGRIDFKYSSLFVDEASSRAIVESPTGWGGAPYLLDDHSLLNSICQWGAYGAPTRGFVNVDDDVTGEWVGRVQKTLWKGVPKSDNLDNSDRLVEEKFTNISIVKSYMEEGKTVTVESAEVKLTFLAESAWNQNSLGYYFYPTNKKPSSPAELEKYVIFPNVSMAASVPFDKSSNSSFPPNKAPLQRGSQVNLLYINEQTGEVSTHFPPGYTIGWFILAKSFTPSKGNLKGNINTSFTNDEGRDRYLYSNESWNRGGQKRCLVFNDSKTGRVIIGFEDSVDKSCEDILFYVESNPKGAISDPNKPEIDEDGEVTIPDKSDEKVGTLLFEDNWPAKGDYDLNDVAVAYKQVVTFNSKNQVVKIVDTFTSVQSLDAATKPSAFAYQIEAGQMGKCTYSSGDVVFEQETNSFVLFPNTMNAHDKEVVITRTFDDASRFNKKDLKKYNPFIIINYVPGNKSRAEVHLPKMKETIYADKELLGSNSDAYYVDRDGKYPFALDVPVIPFTLVTERKTIGSSDEYPAFNSWVKNGCGTESADWYKNK